MRVNTKKCYRSNSYFLTRRYKEGIKDYDNKMRFLSFFYIKIVQNMANYDTIGKWKQASRNERRKRRSYYK